MTKLRLVVPEQTNIIPGCHEANLVQAALKEQGLGVGVTDAGADLGVDTGVGKRATAKLTKRGNDTKRNANRAGFIGTAKTTPT